MLLLAFCALLVTSRLTNIIDAYKYLGVALSGAAFVPIARWYWWRINIWSEISCLSSAFILGNLLVLLWADEPGKDYFAQRMLINFMGTTFICITVTLITSSKVPEHQCLQFYRRVQPSGMGWQEVRKALELPPKGYQASFGLAGYPALSRYIAACSELVMRCFNLGLLSQSVGDSRAYPVGESGVAYHPCFSNYENRKGLS